MFSCELEGSPKPEVVWYRGDTLLDLGERFVASSDELQPNKYMIKLVVKNASPDDSGTFKAEARNPHGTTAANINLNLQGNSSATASSRDTLSKRFNWLYVYQRCTKDLMAGV